MKVIARTDEYTIFQKRSGRYGVRAANRSWINADDKVRILLEHKLIEVAEPKAAPPEEAPEAEAEADAEGGADEGGEEAEASEE